MKALTMQLPYGGVIADGRKRCETRSWATKHRGWIAIHNGKSWPTGLRPFVRQWTGWNDDDLRAEIAAVFGVVDYDNCPGELYEDVNGDGWWSLEPWKGGHYTPGHIVAIAHLSDCAEMIAHTPTSPRHGPLDTLQMSSCIDVGDDHLTYWWHHDGGFHDLTPERGCGHYEAGRYGWMFDDVVRLTEPIPWRGQLGLWNLPEDTAKVVMDRATLRNA